MDPRADRATRRTDGEAIVTDHAGLAVFELIRRQRTSAAVVLCAFDLLELDGQDLRVGVLEAVKLVTCSWLAQYWCR